jgi:hypothetical protein
MSAKIRLSIGCVVLWFASFSFTQDPLILSEENFTIDIGDLSGEIREVIKQPDQLPLQILAKTVDGLEFEITLANPRVLEDNILQATISNYSGLPFGSYQLENLSLSSTSIEKLLPSYSRIVNYDYVIFFLDSDKPPYISDNPKVDELIEQTNPSEGQIVSLSQSGEDHLIELCDGAILALDAKSVDPTLISRLDDELRRLDRLRVGTLPNPRTNLMQAEINPAVGSKDYLQALGLGDEAHGMSSPSQVAVAILDSGVNGDALGTDNIEQIVLTDPKEDLGDIYTRTDSDGNLYNNHGTIVAQLVRQVAPEAKILSIRVCDKEGVCNIPTIIQGFCHAVEVANRNPVVINMSFGTDENEVYSPLLNQIIKDALALENVFVTVAAGNKGEGEDYSCDMDYSVSISKPFYPASLEYVYRDQDEIVGIIAVGAAQLNISGGWHRANFSVDESYIDVFAPGTCLSVEGVQYPRSGTSFSTGLISGVVVHMIYKAIEMNFTLNPTDVENCLKVNTVQQDGSTVGMPDVAKILSDMKDSSPVCDGM